MFLNAALARSTVHQNSFKLDDVDLHRPAVCRTAICIQYLPLTRADNKLTRTTITDLSL